jgi:hypothetical protein
MDILVTYNSGMSGSAKLGLRVLYSSRVSRRLVEPEKAVWSNFTKHMGNFKDITGLEALQEVRCKFKFNGRILLCVDEIKKSANAMTVVEELGEILESDPLTDVVVSALTPTYVKDLVTGSNREVAYVPLFPLPASAEWASFATIAEALVGRARAEMTTEIEKKQAGGGYTRFAEKWKKTFAFKERILKAAPILASGHPRTVLRLIEEPEERPAEWALIQNTLSSYNESAGKLLLDLCGRPCFSQYFTEPATDKERDFILSTEPFVLKKHPLLRRMVEKDRCGVFPAGAGRVDSFLVTTNLATFFGMAKSCGGKNAKRMGRKSVFLKTFFGDAQEVNVAFLWERARALSLCIRSLEKGDTGSNPTYLWSAAKTPLTFLARIQTARLAATGERVQWERGTLILGGEKQAGWDIMVCAEDEEGSPVYILEEVKVSMPEGDLVEVISKKIGLALEDRFAAEAAEDAPKDASQTPKDLLERIVLVFSIYGDVSYNPAELAERVLSHLEEALKVAKEKRDGAAVVRWDRAIQYVRRLFSTHVAIVDKRGLDETMPPVLLPIAALVETATGGASE